MTLNSMFPKCPSLKLQSKGKQGNGNKILKYMASAITFLEVPLGHWILFKHSATAQFYTLEGNFKSFMFHTAAALPAIFSFTEWFQPTLFTLSLS